MGVVRIVVLCFALAAAGAVGAGPAWAQDATDAALMGKVTALMTLVNSVAVEGNADKPLSKDEQKRLKKVETDSQSLYDEAGKGGHVAIQAQARQLLGAAYILTGRTAQAATVLKESAALFRKAGDDGTAGQVEALARAAEGSTGPGGP